MDLEVEYHHHMGCPPTTGKTSLCLHVYDVYAYGTCSLDSQRNLCFSGDERGAAVALNFFFLSLSLVSILLSLYSLPCFLFRIFFHTMITTLSLCKLLTLISLYLSPSSCVIYSIHWFLFFFTVSAAIGPFRHPFAHCA